MLPFDSLISSIIKNYQLSFPINLGSGLAIVKRNFSAFDYLDIPLIRPDPVSEKDGTLGNVPDRVVD